MNKQKKGKFMTKWKEWLLLILLAICLRLAVNLVLPNLPNEGKFVITVLVGIGVILMVARLGKKK